MPCREYSELLDGIRECSDTITDCSGKPKTGAVAGKTLSKEQSAPVIRDRRLGYRCYGRMDKYERKRRALMKQHLSLKLVELLRCYYFI